MPHHRRTFLAGSVAAAVVLLSPKGARAGRYLNAVAAGFDNNNSLTPASVRDSVAAMAIAGNYEGIEFDPGEYNFSDGGWTIPGALSLVCPRPNGARFNLGGELLLNARVAPSEWDRAFIGLDLRCADPANNTHGLRVKLLPSTFLARALFEDVKIRGFGNQGLCLDNSVNNLDGFFLVDVHRCYSEHGYKFIRVGDSMRLTHSQAHSNKGTRTEISGVLIGSATTSAAHVSSIRNCSFTTRGGGVLFTHASGWTVEKNWFEHPGYLGGTLGSPLAQIEMGNCLEMDIIRNVISVGDKTAYNIVAYGGCDGVFVKRNKYPNKGTHAHIYATPSTNRVVVEQIGETYLYDPPAVILQGPNSKVVTQWP